MPVGTRMGLVRSEASRTGPEHEMISARICDSGQPVFDRVDRVKEVVGQPVLPGDDRFWILGDPLVV